ncbi:hypothetical protein [Sphingomonas abietis]|uniref:Uncharacterized protein n=1 Tax=Sphingomonas abietis TaxID=3012344 RepID=A0ABY7NR65_9SPHN|nr:hypothetical protein [Sphingomonas abietis]WBO21981.1 hypothetical protein PBT88_17745 [Sphingomonas abietis]
MKRSRTLRALFARLLKVCALPALALAAVPAHAIEIEPYEYVTIPKDTTLLVFYGYYGEHTAYSSALPGSVKQASDFTSTTAALKLAHYFDIGGHRAFLSAVQLGGGFEEARIGSQRLSRNSGRGDNIIGSGFWLKEDSKNGFYWAIHHY